MRRLYSILKQLALVPACLLIPAGVLLLRTRRRRDPAWWGCAAFLAMLYAVSTPLVGSAALGTLEHVPALATSAPQLQADVHSAGAAAIVVLSADAAWAPEYGGMTVGSRTLMRIRYGARLQRLTGLPMLVSGGRPPGRDVSLAEAMRRALLEDFGVHDVWVEDRSQTTAENATFSAAVLRTHGISRVLLVTSAWHLPRAVAAFAAAGVSVVPAPTDYEGGDDVTAGSFVPSAEGLHQSYYAMHEWLGQLAYRVERGAAAFAAERSAGGVP